MNTLIHLWPAISINESSFAILDTPMFPARFYFGPVGNTPDGFIGMDNATSRYHHSLVDAQEKAITDGFALTVAERVFARKDAERADLILVAQRLAALRSDSAFGEAVSYLPELASVVDHAEAVLKGRPFEVTP